MGADECEVRKEKKNNNNVVTWETEYRYMESTFIDEVIYVYDNDGNLLEKRCACNEKEAEKIFDQLVAKWSD